MEGQSKPNHITAIGATPTSGMVLVSEATGNRPRCRKGNRSMATATPNPRPEPSSQPNNTALTTVCRKSVPSTPRLLNKDNTINQGAGNNTRGTSSATTSSCQK